MKQWVEDAQRGERGAQARLVKHYTAMALAVAYDKLRDIHLAEDAVQESFVEAFLQLDKLSDAARFPGWFKVIVERQCYRVLRRKSFVTVPIHETEPPPSERSRDVESIVEQRELIRHLHRTVADLPASMRMAVQLYYFQGYHLSEIADYLDVSVSALKKRLYDARRKLKSILHVADFVSVFTDLHEGGVRMLHIVNGDSVGDKLRQGNIRGDILVWRELYTFGPVFMEMDTDEHLRERAAYLERTLGIPQTEFIANCNAQESKLRNLKAYDEVVLWFEHDLYDQTMLSYLLHKLKGYSLGDTKLSLLCIGSYPGIELFRGLGQLSTEQLETLSGTWQSIGQDELVLGSRVWEAYTSDQPEVHEQLLASDTSALPFVREAFEAHLSRWPSAHNGLGIIEQTILKKVEGGETKPHALFRSVGDELHVLGMGDLEFWYYLSTMAAGSNPLLEVQGVVPSANFKQTSPADFRESVIKLTSLGARVLAGTADAAGLYAVEKWVGGLHLVRGS
ncbi:sigma-70 family RNA polymerase sigma factor [Peribacillus sp. NPDC056705]|uniref:sigma-70 family RNA polymerase sigma factor n=1 Tax=Peribacillus sp. NPDC056705 TaxID=3345918 RepID=UPI0037494E06